MTNRAAQLRSLRSCAVLVFAACTGGGNVETGLDPPLPPPEITAAGVECDVPDARWSFQVTANAWTGNGQVLLSTDGVYVERHPMYSASAAADGTSDSLALSLSVQPDWRDVVLGTSTVFNCNEPDLTGILRVYTRDGSEQADCRAFGAAPERWAVWSAGATCETQLETD